MAGPARFVGVVADLGAILFAVQGLMVVSISSINGVLNALCTLPISWGQSQELLCSALMRDSARRRASSLMILFIPKIWGLTASLRRPVMWA